MVYSQKDGEGSRLQNYRNLTTNSMAEIPSSILTNAHISVTMNGETKAALIRKWMMAFEGNEDHKFLNFEGLFFTPTYVFLTFLKM